MKKILFVGLFIISLCFIGNLNAQAFKKGDIMLSPGIGLGIYGSGYGAFGFAIPIILNADWSTRLYKRGCL